jgi:transposase
LNRHRLLAAIAGDTSEKKTFTPDPISYCYVDIADGRTEEGKSYLFVAIDRNSTFVYAERHPEASKTVATQFRRHRSAIGPYKLHTVLTDHGIQFTNRKQNQYAFTHLFAQVGDEHGIAQRLTKTLHPWTNGQVEHMNRTRKDAMVKKYYDQTPQHL